MSLFCGVGSAVDRLLVSDIKVIHIAHERKSYVFFMAVYLQLNLFLVCQDQEKVAVQRLFNKRPSLFSTVHFCS